MTIQLLNKDYTFDSMIDIEQDIFDCLNPSYNAAAIAIPEYEDGQKMGYIRVKVEWIDG